MATMDTAECRAALTLIRRTIEEYCLPGVLPSEEMVNGLCGPDLIHEAEAVGNSHRRDRRTSIGGYPNKSP